MTYTPTYPHYPHVLWNCEIEKCRIKTNACFVYYGNMGVLVKQKTMREKKNK